MIQSKNKFRCLSILLFGLLTSCSSDANFKAYLLADRLDYEAQAPHYLSLVEAHMPVTTDSERATKAAVIRRVEQKGRTLTEAEKYVGIK